MCYIGKDNDELFKNIDFAFSVDWLNSIKQLASELGHG